MTNIYHFSQIQHIPQDVYLDANFIIYYTFKPSKSKKDDYRIHINAIQLMATLMLNKINIHISMLVLNEVWYILAKKFYESARGKGSWNREKDRGAICKKFSSKLKIATEKLFKIPTLELIPSKGHKKIAENALDNIENYPLLPADALHDLSTGSPRSLVVGGM